MMMGRWDSGLWGTDSGADSGRGDAHSGQWSRLGAKEQTEDFGADAGDLYQSHIHNHTH